MRNTLVLVVNKWITKQDKSSTISRRKGPPGYKRR